VRRVLALLFVFLLLTQGLLARTAFAAPSALTRVQDAGVLRWGGDVQGGEPYVYADPANPEKLIGFEVDIAEALGKELGVRTEFVQADWSTLVASLERGTFDIAMNGLENTTERKARLFLTRPYYIFAERLMVRRNAAWPAASLESLNGKRVGTLANSLAFELLRDHATPVLYEGVDEPYLDLVSGRTDAVLLDDVIAERYGVPKPELRVLGDVAEGAYVIAARRSEPELGIEVDAAVGRLIAKGELRRILTRAHLWNARQERLAGAPMSLTRSPGEGSASSEPSVPSVPPRFGLAHLRVFIKAAGVTFALSFAAMALAVTLGLLLALARMYGGPLLRGLASGYVEIYRGTPLLLQLYLLYFGLAPLLSLGAWSASILALGMNYAAYEAETYRAGIQAVPADQMEAALSLGMTRGLALRRIVLPQAIRHALPNVTNDFIALLKDSSLVSVITLVELTKQMTITAVDVRSWLLPGLACAALYFAMSYPLGVLSRRLEKKLKGSKDANDRSHTGARS